jgi:adenine-specific DNA-methyltransferase
MFLSEARGLTPINFWDHEYAGNTDQGTLDLEKLMPGKLFNNPKPVQLIKRVLEHATDPDALVLDFFAGSGTTAQAVMQLNAEDGGTRRFILVQLPEATDPNSAAQRAGYATISDLTKERIRRSGKAILGESELISRSLDIGFRVLKIDTSNMKDVYYAPDAVQQGDLVAHTDNIKDDRTPEDLLFHVLVDWGVDLSLPVNCETIAGKDVFFVDGNALAACFESEITEDLIKALAMRKPLRVVFRDRGYGSDSMKINAEQIFKYLSPTSELRSI